MYFFIRNKIIIINISLILSGYLQFLVASIHIIKSKLKMEDMAIRILIFQFNFFR